MNDREVESARVRLILQKREIGDNATLEDAKALVVSILEDFKIGFAGSLPALIQARLRHAAIMNEMESAINDE